MNYTIAVLEMIHLQTKLDFNKSGKWYYIGFQYYDENGKRVWVHTSDILDFETALAIYNKFSDLMLRALYSNEEKAKMLQAY